MIIEITMNDIQINGYALSTPQGGSAFVGAVQASIMF